MLAAQFVSLFLAWKVVIMMKKVTVMGMDMVRKKLLRDVLLPLSTPDVNVLGSRRIAVMRSVA